MTQLSIVFERILDSIQKVFSNLFGWVKATISEKARTETKTLIRTEVKTIEINRLTKWQKAMISLEYVFIGICLLGVICLLCKVIRK